MCENEKETMEHVLLQCEWVGNVWFGLDIGYKVDRQQITTFDKWLGKFCNMKGVEWEGKKEGRG